MAKKLLTEAQKKKRAANRIKFKKLHFEFVIKGDCSPYEWAREEYYNKAQEYYKKYKQNGGRDW